MVTAVIMTGCSFNLPSNLAGISDVGGCSSWDIDTVLQLGSTFDRKTPLKTLECTLSILRNEWHKTIDRGRLGARTCFLLADASTDSDRRHLLASEGVRWAEIALNLGAWIDGSIHYYLAVNLGMAVQDTIVVAIKNLDRLESELKTALHYAPGVDQGGPSRVLGMLYLQAPPWPKGIGDGEKAVRMLAKTAWEYPDHPLNHIFLAQALWDVEGDDVLVEVRDHLAAADQLLRHGDWGYANSMWARLISDLVTDIGRNGLLESELLECGG